MVTNPPPSFVRASWQHLTPSEFAEMCSKVPPSRLSAWLAALKCHVRPTDLNGAGGRLALTKIRNQALKRQLQDAELLTDAVLPSFEAHLGEAYENPTLEDLRNVLDILLDEGLTINVLRLVLAVVTDLERPAAEVAQTVLLQDARFRLPEWSRRDDDATRSNRDHQVPRSVPGGASRATPAIHLPESSERSPAPGVQLDDLSGHLQAVKQRFTQATDAMRAIIAEVDAGRPPSEILTAQLVELRPVFETLVASYALCGAENGIDLGGLNDVGSLERALEILRAARGDRDLRRKASRAASIEGPADVHGLLSEVHSLVESLDEVDMSGVRAIAALCDLISMVDGGEDQASIDSAADIFSETFPSLKRLAYRALMGTLRFSREENTATESSRNSQPAVLEASAYQSSRATPAGHNVQATPTALERSSPEPSAEPLHLSNEVDRAGMAGETVVQEPIGDTVLDTGEMEQEGTTHQGADDAHLEDNELAGLRQAKGPDAGSDRVVVSGKGKERGEPPSDPHDVSTRSREQETKGKPFARPDDGRAIGRPEARVRGDDDHQDRGEPKAGPSQLSEIAATVEAAQFSLGAWLVRASNGPSLLRQVLEIAALARAAWSENSDTAARASSELAKLDLEELKDYPLERLIACAAAAKVALVAPYSDAAAFLRRMVERQASDDPSKEMFTSVLRCAEAGLLPLQIVSPQKGVDALTFTEKASRLLNEGPDRGAIYQLAAAVWRSWLQPNGPLALLLRPVALDEKAKATSVGARALELRDRRAVERLVDATAARLRPQKRARIEARARQLLIARVAEAAELALAWSGAVAQAQLDRSPQAAALEELRALLEQGHISIREVLGAALAPGTVYGDETSCGVAIMLAEAAPGAVLPIHGRRPWNADDVLVEPALRAFEVMLIADQAVEPVPIAPFISVANGRTWKEAFHGRCEVGDYDLAERLLELHAIDSDEYVKLSDELEAHLSAARVAVDRLGEHCRIELETAQRLGLISQHNYANLHSTLVVAQSCDRKDLRLVRGELAEVEQAIARDQERAMKAIREELTRAGVSDEDRRRIDGLIDQNEVATARAYLDLARRGIPIPSREESPIQVDLVFPGLIERLHDVSMNRTLLPAIGQGRDVGPLSWAKVPAADRNGVRNAVGGWFDLANRELTGHVQENLRYVLGVLGVDRVENIRIEPASTRVQPRRWVEVNGHANRRSPVPQFGTDLQERFQILLCWESASERNVREWVNEHEGSGGVFVLYFGLASLGFRQHLADLGRRPGAERPIAFIDIATFLYCSTLPTPSYEVMIRLCLPFCPVNPYKPFGGGLVPVEMFYGRMYEMSRVLDRDGPSIVYGGRQLGKSAIMRAAEREVANSTSRRALFVDLAGHDIQPNTMDEFWSLVDEGLNKLRIPVGEATKIKPLAERVLRRIQAWLDEDGQREFLLLVDEVDRFLNCDDAADPKQSFVNTWRLKRLRDDTGHRFKPVLTGLHDVARFRSRTNPPFAHLESMVIGPMVPQEAFDLIDKPLEALGFRADIAAINRVLAYTHFNPGLIQLFCRDLVNKLNERPIQGRNIPHTVTTDDIERVHATVDLAGRLRERFMATLHLDHRFLVIVLALAKEGDETGWPVLLPVSEIRRLCDTYWPLGFANTTYDAFQGLVDELVEFGVMRGENGQYGIAGPHVRLMLGSAESISQTLGDTKALEVVDDVSSAGVRAPISSEAFRRSPLTSAQLSLMRLTGRLSIVVGSKAMLVDRVVETLAWTFGSRNNIQLVRVSGQDDLWERVRVSGGADEMVVCELTQSDNASIARMLKKWDEIKPSQTSAVWIAEWPSGWSDPELNQDAHLTVLERWHRSALHLALADVAATPATPRQLRDAMDVTGGWPILVDRLLEGAAHTSISKAVAQVGEALSSREGAREFLLATGIIGRNEIWESLKVMIDFGDGLTPDDLGVFVQLDDADLTSRLLRMLGLVTVTDTGALVVDPVVARAVSVSSDGAVNAAD